MDKSAIKWVGVTIVIFCFAYLLYSISGGDVSDVTGMTVSISNQSATAPEAGTANDSLNLEDLIVDGLNFVVTGSETQEDSDVSISDISAESALSGDSGAGDDSFCRTNFTIKALRHNVKIYLNGTYGKIDVLVKDNTPGNVTCQNGQVVKSMRDCVPKGLVEFLNAPFKVSDLVEFRCSSGAVTDTLQDCLPAFADAPPEEFFELKCRHSNVTISSLECKDECFAERVRWFVSELDRKLIEKNSVQS